MGETEEIPLTDPGEDDPFLDEISGEDIDGSDLESDYQDEDDDDLLSEINQVGDISDNKPSVSIGDTYIMLLESKDKPFLGKIIEIFVDEGIAKMETDSKKILSFEFESGEILMKTDTYEILDLLRVLPHKPEEDGEIESEIELDSDELLNKQYSDIAKKDDMLSALIHSLGVYDDDLLLERMQIITDEFLYLIENEKIDKTDKSFPKWLIPIVDDNLKLYDEANLYYLRN